MANEHKKFLIKAHSSQLVLVLKGHFLWSTIGLLYNSSHMRKPSHLEGINTVIFITVTIRRGIIRAVEFPL